MKCLFQLTLEEYVKDLEERLATKKELREGNLKAPELWQEAEDRFVQLDSSLKKNTAFIKRLV